MSTALNDFTLQLNSHHCGNLWAAVLRQQLADLVFFIPKKKIKYKKSYEVETYVDWDALKKNDFVKEKYCTSRIAYCRQALNWFNSPYYPFVCNLAGIDKGVIDRYVNKITDYVVRILEKKQSDANNKTKKGKRK